jgi:DNA mismatch endonuclease (patch repair protein)
VHDKATRSRNMSHIRYKNTKPELVIRRDLHRMGFRYRLHNPHLPSKPDMVFSKYSAIILINGCFWHQHEANKLGHNKLGHTRSKNHSPNSRSNEPYSDRLHAI